MVTAKHLVERFKLSRLPAGSHWNEIGGPEHKWVTTVMVGSDKWAVLVVEVKDRWVRYAMRIVNPQGQSFQWPSLFTRSEEARGEAERWAQAIKKSGSVSLAGWKPL